MRNYEMMRHILVMCYTKGEDIEYLDFVNVCKKDYKEKDKQLQTELDRLSGEGLLTHNMWWADNTFMGGTVKGLTPAGIEFARMISSMKVWAICKDTLENSKLDISYPLIKKVCERIIENIVLSCIPKEF